MRNKYSIYKALGLWWFQFKMPIATSFKTWQEAIDYFNEMRKTIAN